MDSEVYLFLFSHWLKTTGLLKFTEKKESKKNQKGQTFTREEFSSIPNTEAQVWPESALLYLDEDKLCLDLMMNHLTFVIGTGQMPREVVTLKKDTSK